MAGGTGVAADRGPKEVRRRARGGLGWLGLFGGTCLVLGSLPWLGVSIPCPFLSATGWQCPFCGATRMGRALLRGDLVAAWQFNPAVLLLAAGCAVAVLVLLGQLITGRSRNFAGRPDRVRPGWVARGVRWVARARLPVVVALLLGWGLARNLWL